MSYKVVKRDGREVQFDIGKVLGAIGKAFEAKEQVCSNPSLLATKVMADAETKVVDGKLSVEDIQDSVEAILIQEGYAEVAKGYILYRDNRSRTRAANETLVSCRNIVDSYLKESDWRVKESSTVSYSIGGLILSNNAAVTANYWLNDIYDKEVGDAHKNADLHIHDLSILGGYCAGWSLKQLIEEGLGGVTGKVASSPPRHLSTLCNQMVNFLGIMQNEWAGAQAFSSFDTYLAPFVKVDNLSYKEVKQNIQSFVYGVNTPSRWGTQAPFSNITLDWVVPADLANQPAIVGGKPLDFTYGDCQKEMDIINKAFLEVMIEGDADGRGFAYPIPTYNITRSFNWDDTENNQLLFEMTAKYGTPYFSNYVNSDLEPTDVRSMCVTPDTLVWVRSRETARSTCIPIKDFYDNYNVDTARILSKGGYKPLREMQRFKYEGDLIKFSLSNGRTLTTTPDHEHIILKEKGRRRFINIETGEKKLLPVDTPLEGWVRVPTQYSTATLVKEKAFNIKIGDVFTCRHPNPGEKRKGLTYEEIYGEEKAKQLKTEYSEQRKGRPAWNKGVPVTEEVKAKISKGLMGHYVSEKCRQASSERWLGDKNPHRINGKRIGSKNISISEYESSFANELEALDLNFIHQYQIKEAACVSDFYIPEKNLIIELEVDYRKDYCAYNDLSEIFIQNLLDKYNKIIECGYNLLIFNPKTDSGSYRPYINEDATIINIEYLPYSGYVYDVEVDANTEMEHSFYANNVLTGNCCRLRLDLRELRRKAGGFFGSGENTGSVGVVTINIPRLAYLATDQADFYARLTHLMDIAARSLDTKRRVITQYLENGLYPYTKRYLHSYDNHFSTLGLVGMNEACLNAAWLGKDLTHAEAQEWTKDVLNFMRNKLSDYQEQYGYLYNLEATPAESTAFRFAKHDKKRYPSIITAAQDGTATPYYTNSSHLPVWYTDDVFQALAIQDELQTLYTSGTVFHTFLGEKMPSWKAARNLVRTIADNYKLPYYTLSPTYSICPNHGYLIGEQPTCPTCNTATEVYSRITGYYRPVQHWNDGKTQEFHDRNEYKTGIQEVKWEARNAGEVSPSLLKEEGAETATYYLATLPTCPNCPTAKEHLNKAGIEYVEVQPATNPIFFADHPALAMAPTLVVNGKLYSGLSGITSYIKESSHEANN